MFKPALARLEQFHTQPTVLLPKALGSASSLTKSQAKALWLGWTYEDASVESKRRGF